MDNLAIPAKTLRRRWCVVIVVGLAAGALNAFWMTYMQVVWNQGFPTVLSIYFNSVFTLVVLAVFNAGLRRVLPRAAMSAVELLVIFVMANVATSIQMLCEYIVSQLPYPFYYRELDARYAVLIKYLPDWLTVSDPQAVRDFYLGRADLWHWQSLKPWLVPAAAWGGFLLAVVLTGVCLASLVYNRWRYHEKLSFPLLQIPLMIAEPRTGFHRTWLFWIGFGVAAGIDVLNALNAVFPAVPGLQVKRAALHMPGLARPWTALDPVLYSFNPFLIGLEFFLPLDLLFSVVFFFFAGRMEAVMLSFFGADVSFSPDNMVAPYVREQSFGALMSLLLFSLWLARGHWRESWRQVRTIIRPDISLLGASLGALSMVAILVAAGFRGYTAVSLVAVFIAVAVSLARIRAQYGPPNAGLFLAAPGAVIYQAMGPQALGPGGLANLSLVHWLGWDHTHNPLPDTLEGHAMTEGRMSPGVLIVSVFLAAAAAYVVTFGTILAISYELGQGSARTSGTQVYYARDACAAFANRLTSPVRGVQADSVAATAFGAAVALALQAVRTRYVGFPLHPVGYAVASSYASTFLWSTALLTWTFKLALLRYWGLKGYYRAAPFFLGLVIGEFTAGSLLSILSVALRTNLYVFWPY